MYTYRIEQAIKAASILHKGQVRKGEIPLPYISHLVAVTFIVADYTDDEDTLIAALLHDTIEDTDYNADELLEDFGGDVQQIVLALSEPADESDKEYTWKEKKQKYAKQLKKAPEAALIISAADKIHNMRTIVEEYYDDHVRFMSEFRGSLDDRALMYEDISNVLNARLENDIVAEFNHVFTEYKNFLTDVKKTQEINKNR